MEVMNPVAVVHHPHPVLPAAGRYRREHAWRPGETVRELLIRQGLDPHQEITVTLNDRLLTVAEWDTVCVRPDDILNVSAVVSGGGGGEDGGGSNAGQIVAMIVVIVLAYWTGGAAAGAWGAGGASSMAASTGISASLVGSITTAVVMAAGSALVSAMFAPSGRALSSANGLDAAGRDTPNYSLSGGSNSLRPYEPLPVVMGTHRIFPDYGAKPYTEYQGEDQYLYQIFNFGLSSLSLTDFKIGETLLSDYSGVSLYWGDANGRIPGFPGNVDSDAGAQLIRGAGWTTRTTSPDTMEIAVDIEGSVYYQGDRGLLSCAATIEAYYAPVGSGAWVPMASRTIVSYTTGYWSLQATVRVPQDPENGLIWFDKLVQHDFASTGHAEGEAGLIRAAYTAANAEGTPYVVPAEYGTWRWISFADADSNRFPHPDPIASYSTAYDLDVQHGASQRAQRNTLRVSVPKGQYDVRVRLTSARSSNGEISDGDTRGGYQYSFSVLRSYQEDPASYAGQTRVGLVIKASGQLNGVVQKLSAMATAYCRIWNGTTWVWGPTSNPAFWFIDFALGRKTPDGKPMYGCQMGWEQIDVPALIAWANFCASEGLSCNLILDRAQSAWDTLTTIARCGMASPSYASGKLGVVWDKKNASPVAAFGMSNIIKGSFSVQYVTENLADEIVVSFVDAGRDWQQQQVRALSPGVTNPVRSSTVELMGCTNARMAGKFANYLAAQQVYRKRMISWESDFEGFACQRGDVVILSHDLTQWGYSGRLVSVDGATLTLERKVPRSGAAEYLMVAFPDGTLTTYTVMAGTGEQDVITLTAPLALQSGYAAMDHRWFFSPLPTPGKRVKIVSVRPVSQSRIAIVATDEEPGFYSAWNGEWSQPGQSTLLQNKLPAIKALTVSEMLFAVNTGGISNRITLSASISDSYEQIYWKWRFAGGAWTTETSSATSISFDTAEFGQLEVTARAHSGYFFGAPFTTVKQILGEAAPPGNVANFQSRITGSSLWLTYTPAPEIDVILGGGIRIRHASALTGATWESASDLFQGPAPASGVSVPAMVGTYLAKFFDATGHESPTATALVNEVSISLIEMNVVDVMDDAPAWAGVHDGTRYDAALSAVVLDAVDYIDAAPDFDTIVDIDRFGGVRSIGYYELADSIDIGSAAACRISGAVTFSCIATGSYIDEIADFDAIPDIDGVVIGGGSAVIQVALSQDGVSYGPWIDLFSGEAVFRKIKARIFLQADITDINVVVTAASVTVDMPDRTESGNDIVSGAGVCNVTYSRQFQVAPALSITAQDMASGDYYVISGKSTSGFSITFKNSAGTNISRTFDFLAKRY